MNLLANKPMNLTVVALKRYLSPPKMAAQALRRVVYCIKKCLIRYSR